MKILMKKIMKKQKLNQLKICIKLETPQKFYPYLSSKKLINNFHKIDKLKK